ncbi:MAG: histidine phosphatase family protein, partial [Anaerolineales bacterium]|nr:histidine phosphatase family protein [Anaerolineales bacterium]
MRLVLIRHGETDWNIEGRYQGQEDPPLNSAGVTQSFQLANKLVNLGLDVLYSSPLKRASQTAEIISSQLDLPLFIEPRFMEIHQGKWQNSLRSEIESQYPDLFKRWEDQPWEVQPPEGETLTQVQARVYAALDEIIPLHKRQTVGIVCHRIPIALIKMRYQDVDRNIVRKLKLPNSYY